MKKKSQLPRRTFLKGLGASIALPMLDCMAPLKAAAAGATASPCRMAFLFVPNGVHIPDWVPSAEGANFDLPYILEPLAPVKRDLLILSGLTHDKGRGNGDGPGDHARCAGVYLTGAQPLKSEGSSIRAGVSVDQLCAQRIGHETRFASLELGTEKGRQSGKCDSGYSCAYSNNVSWRNEVTPMAKETNPRLVFERLFANELGKEVSESQTRRQRYKKSILDFVLEDAKQLNRRVAYQDKQKLDEYLTAVREIETRIVRTETQGAGTDSESAFSRPSGTPDSYEEHLRLMGDMLILAFQSDVTRVATYMFANAGSNKSYSFIGVREGHHSLSHHGGNPEKHAKIRQINRFHVAQLSYILQKMKATPDGESNLLDNSMIVYGSSISDGNRHNNENLPILLAGKGGGSILSGRHLRYPFETPMCNFFESMLNRMGAQVDRFGDSTGPLRGLSG